MKYWRNPEVKRELVIYFIIFVVFNALAGALDMPARYAVIITLIYTLLHFASSYIRYERIRRLSEQIDNILHNGYSMQFADNIEGELSVLENEVHKALLRLTDSENRLVKDKQGLENSIADISHQLRTPLTSINLITERISDSTISEEKRRELVFELKMLLKRLEWLVEALLKISRIDSDTVEFRKDRIKVSEIVNKAYEPLSIPMELKDIVFRVEVGEEDIIGDLIWNSEALGNILKNCMEHTPSGGTISINVNDTAVYTEIIIKDTGKGILKEDIPHIFERFYRGSDASENSFGIGLALARMIVKAQNGTIKASNYKEGACFTIRFYKSVV